MASSTIRSIVGPSVEFRHAPATPTYESSFRSGPQEEEAQAAPPSSGRTLRYRRRCQVADVGEPGSLVGSGCPMHSDSSRPVQDDGLHRPNTRSALRISLVSVAWTVVSSAVAVAVGIASHIAVLVAFGAVGTVDAIGSIALAYHFGHSLRHHRQSDHLERIAHRLVFVGLLTVACGAVSGGLLRLGAVSTNSSGTGVALAAVSLAVLTALAMRKAQIARRIHSHALRSDAHLSTIGASLPGITVVGMGTAAALGWHWTDAVATILVGCIAAWLAMSTWRPNGDPDGTCR